MEMNNAAELPVGYTLIYGVVSAGHIAQLAMELLVNTLRPTLLSHVHHDALLPCASFNASPLLLFVSHEHKLAFLQQVSDIVPNRRDEFRQDLLKWLAERQFSQIVILTGSQASDRIDSQLTGTQMRYLATPDVIAKLSSQNLQSFTIPPLELREETRSNPHGIYITGGGVARQLFLDCEQKSIPATCLIAFCNEEVSPQFAQVVASSVTEYLALSVPTFPKVSRWEIPSSWHDAQQWASSSAVL